MNSNAKLPYQKLSNCHIWFEDAETGGHGKECSVVKPRNWRRFRKGSIRKRFKLKVPSLRKFLKKRFNIVSAVRTCYARVLKRFKDSQVKFSDLFAGNYVFLQVNPTSLEYIENSCQNNDHNGISSNCSLKNAA